MIGAQTTGGTLGENLCLHTEGLAQLSDENTEAIANRRSTNAVLKLPSRSRSCELEKRQQTSRAPQKFPILIFKIFDSISLSDNDLIRRQTMLE